MSETQSPEPQGTVAEGEEWVKGEGGPAFTQGGMVPGGSEMENWKKVVTDDSSQEPPIEEQADNLRERLDEK
ncbi:MAG: hypothetical protein ABR540_12700 [Acidimicrobiales bacterium]|nr:hypothetical protein [Actinomycetota bacterium]